MLPVLLIALGAVTIAGCAGNSHGTPAGTTQITINAKAGALTHSATVTLTVQ